VLQYGKTPIIGEEQCGCCMDAARWCTRRRGGCIAEWATAWLLQVQAKGRASLSGALCCASPSSGEGTGSSLGLLTRLPALWFNVPAPQAAAARIRATPASSAALTLTAPALAWARGARGAWARSAAAAVLMSQRMVVNCFGTLYQSTTGSTSPPAHVTCATGARRSPVALCLQVCVRSVQHEGLHCILLLGGRGLEEHLQAGWKGLRGALSL